jgi:hypothetical protein
LLQLLTILLDEIPKAIAPSAKDTPERQHGQALDEIFKPDMRFFSSKGHT